MKCSINQFMNDLCTNNFVKTFRIQTRTQMEGLLYVSAAEVSGSDIYEFEKTFFKYMNFW